MKNMKKQGKKHFSGKGLSIKQKVTLWYACMLVLIVLLLFGFIFSISRSLLQRESDSRLEEVVLDFVDDIDFENKTISVNKNILKKNQAGGTKQRHLSGNSTTVWYFGTCKTEASYRIIPIGDTLINALKTYKKEQEENKINYGDTYMKHYKKNVISLYNNKTETKIVNAYSEIDVALEEVNFVFVKKNGVYEGTDSCKYPFKVIHYELGIPCRFHDFRDTHATKLIESGADIKAVSKRLGHINIDITYNIYVRVTEKMEIVTSGFKKQGDLIAGSDLSLDVL